MTDVSGHTESAGLPEAVDVTEQAAHLLRVLRKHSPLVHNITNHVATNFSANALLAIGAAPAMVDTAEEAGVFAPMASGLLINLGTLSHQQRDAGRAAVSAASEAGTPWVLDPVAIGALPLRTGFAAELLAAGPTAVRGNASEIIALAGAGAGGRGVDSADDTDTAAPVAAALARETSMVVAVSGARDLITDGSAAIRVDNGHPLLTRITGAGCALGSIIAAMLGARGTTSALTAVSAAHVVYGIAAEQAATDAHGPGTFLPAFLDALAGITPEQVIEQARVEVLAAPAPDPQEA
ncbi:hydroxyethylthiazole kinase [Pseudactinotalea sp. Z1739]|uniref:hydroxyethylthiazole kinase n=1 Tax=Pseudactinotalea sp. Z1739 TaxID=3413028 RepID=UPI003C797649